MKKASEYRKHAAECRALAQKVKQGEQRDQLLDMAKTWERLAADRSALVRRRPEVALEGESHEESAREDSPT